MLFGITVPSYAQTNSSTATPPASSGTFFSGMQNVATQLAARLSSSTADAMAAKGMEYAEKVKNPALAIGGALALLYLFVEAVSHIGGSGKSSMLNVIFDIAVPAMIASFLIGNYPLFIDKVGQLLNVFKFQDGGIVNSIASYYGTILYMISDAILQSLNAITLKNLWSSLIDVLASILFSMMILTITFISLADLIGLVLMGPFLFAVGVAFGPLMIASIVTPWTRPYFTKWVGFIVGTAVLTGIVTIVLNIAMKLFSTEALGFSHYDNATPTAVNLAIALIMIMAVNSLITQAPSIASALVPGQIGATKADAGKSAAGAGESMMNVGKSHQKLAGLAMNKINKARGKI
jgi:hypothetical protein